MSIFGFRRGRIGPPHHLSPSPKQHSLGALSQTKNYVFISILRDIRSIQRGDYMVSDEHRCTTTIDCGDESVG